MKNQIARIGAKAVIIKDSCILLIAYDDQNGFHYNLPGGGLEPGESIEQCLIREVREETTAIVTIGRFLFAQEYFPPYLNYKYGRRHSVGFIFEAHLHPESEPHLPANPDRHQIGVDWVPLKKLPDQPLYPEYANFLIKCLKKSGKLSFFLRDL